MERFEHGGDIYTHAGVLDFSASLNPLGMPASAVRALREGVAACEAYPDPHCRELRAAIASFEDVSEDWVLPCAGATDAFARICQALRPSRSLVCAPCYSGYEQALEQVGAQVICHVMSERDGFEPTLGLVDTLPAVLTVGNGGPACAWSHGTKTGGVALPGEAPAHALAGGEERRRGGSEDCSKPRVARLSSAAAAPDRRASLPAGACAATPLGSASPPDAVPCDQAQAGRAGQPLLFLANPNNPTGRCLSREVRLACLDTAAACGAVVVLDECFIDLTDQPGSNDLLARNPHLVIVKALTKTFSLAGLRVGYALCANRDLLQRLRDAGQPWAVSVPAQLAGVASLQDGPYLRQSRELIARECERLAAVLCDLGLEVMPSQVNYLLFKGQEGLCERLLAQGILIRCCENFVGLGSCWYRVAVRTEPENRQLIDALREVL